MIKKRQNLKVLALHLLRNGRTRTCKRNVKLTGSLSQHPSCNAFLLTLMRYTFAYITLLITLLSLYTYSLYAGMHSETPPDFGFHMVAFRCDGFCTHKHTLSTTILLLYDMRRTSQGVFKDWQRGFSFDAKVERVKTRNET